jgi:hypothetical protein
MYKRVLLAYDGSIEGRRALREGAKLALPRRRVPAGGCRAIFYHGY